jgi:ABC-2 type transport system permease protein
MRSLAEENRLGTIELLLTKPVNHWQIVAGKFAAVLMLILVALLFTLPYYISVAKLGPIDHGSVISGYLGLILMSSVYIAIGIFASSVSSNQIVAFLSALFISIFFHWIFEMLGSNLPGFAGSFLTYLSVSAHFDALTRGVIDSKDIIYFISVTMLALLGARLSLESKRS